MSTTRRTFSGSLGDADDSAGKTFTSILRVP